jgi:hypothetical protein
MTSKAEELMEIQQKIDRVLRIKTQLDLDGNKEYKGWVIVLMKNN